MIAAVACGALHGVNAFRVDLEVDFARQGLPSFAMVGLAEGAVKEARDRVFAALRAGGLQLPPGRITVNLAPADRKKGGSAYDLPLAVGLLAASGQVPPEAPAGFFLCGELSLAGELKPVPGVLPLALLAREQGAKACIVPEENAREAAAVEGLIVYGPRRLSEVVAFFRDGAPLAAAVPPAEEESAFRPPLLDFSDVKGQEHAKRAIEIAAAGGHNLLFLGPPGSGKTMLAQRIPSVLPPLSPDEALEVTKIYSVAGLLRPERGIIRERPFRSPHHTISEPGLVGGGASPKPGEISLAHRGVLFLDELLEFRKSTLEVLRQPLEDGVVTISRALHTLTYPAGIMLVAAMNPCPCGYQTDTRRACVCSAGDIARYRARLSGPLLDRIDLHVEVPAVPFEDLDRQDAGKSSDDMRKTIDASRQRQSARYAGSACRGNAELSGKALDRHCRLNTEGRLFLKEAVDSLNLSARAYTRILRISRTIADLDASPDITTAHLAEAVNCRALDRTR